MKDKDFDRKPGAAALGSELADTGRTYRQLLAQGAKGASPVSAMRMMTDWALHLATAPDKQISLAFKAQENWMEWTRSFMSGTPSRRDRRFAHEAWDRPPYAAMAQAFLLMEDYFDAATTDVPGLDPAHDKAMTFAMRQMLDAMAPSNFLLSNPEALAETIRSQGANLARGSAQLWQDAQDRARGKRRQPTKIVGKDVATTKGRVVLRTHLMELIQYTPLTEEVHPEPVMIVPAWIMKYYILDLSPENSMVRFLLAQGFTVFILSWRNPDAEDAGLGMLDYLAQGPMAALDHITAKTGAARVHGVGYCLGGTLLSLAAAHLARTKDERLGSVTLLAAQTDFSEAGELMLFINESQVSVLEDVMAAQGYLDAHQIMSAFQMLRSNDLVWSQMVRAYLMGEEPPEMTDLMSWNADSTRMPARMHSEYLRHMFLNNDLAAGRYKVDGRPVSLRDIRLPVFAVGTETDHIAPWTSVFKIHNLGHADVTFALTNGGHNAGVISEPGHRRRRYRLRTTRDADPALSPQEWFEATAPTEGSWWPAWAAWLAERSGPKGPPPKMSGRLGAAPGAYVKVP